MFIAPSSVYDHGLGEPPQEAEPRALGFARGVRLVPEVGVLGVGRDLVVGDGEPRGAEGFLADLLAELVEAVAHGERSMPWRPSAAQEAYAAKRCRLRAVVMCQ
jgi:hypothetical protein